MQRFIYIYDGPFSNIAEVQPHQHDTWIGDVVYDWDEAVSFSEAKREAVCDLSARIRDLQEILRRIRQSRKADYQPE